MLQFIQFINQKQGFIYSAVTVLQ